MGEPFCSILYHPIIPNENVDPPNNLNEVIKLFYITYKLLVISLSITIIDVATHLY